MQRIRRFANCVFGFVQDTTSKMALPDLGGGWLLVGDLGCVLVAAYILAIVLLWVAAAVLVGVVALALLPFELAVLLGIGGGATTVAAVKIVSVAVKRGKCPVCRVKLRADTQVLRCQECATAYHRDCWQMVGKCARYGCARSTAKPI